MKRRPPATEGATSCVEGTPADGDSLQAGVKAAVPVLVGYLATGFAFGLVARTSGLTLAEMLLMSVLVYAGASQFAAAAMMARGDPPGAIVATTFLINLRHLLFGLSLAPALRGAPWWRLLRTGLQLTDETFALAAARSSGSQGSGLHPGNRPVPRLGVRWLAGVQVSAQGAWVLATWAGGVLGLFLPDPTVLGLDYALPALFIGILVMQATDRARARAAILGGCLTLILGIAMPGRWAVLLATAVAATVGVWSPVWTVRRNGSG